MPFLSRKAKLKISEEQVNTLETLTRSRTEPHQRVERATILLSYYRGDTISAIARTLRTNRVKVERTINKALELGMERALDDLPRPGKPPSITPEARAWVVSLACQKPKDLGYSFELWTTRLLADHIRAHCRAAGHPSLEHIARGTVSKILSRYQVKPHRIRYYLEKRDPEFDRKMAEVLHVYHTVQLIAQGEEQPLGAYLSYDEKPGLQAIGSTSEDLPPCPGTHPTFQRDSEYKRFGTVSLLAGIDLLTGEILATVEDRHRSREFVAFLELVDQRYPPHMTINVILDNHSSHISKETRAYLATVPNRFSFVFTPKHGSWLNLIESFFGKMAQSFLRGIRVTSKAELKERIFRYFEE
ncbi:MAG TPA: IS630 family transposase, partial [Atribacteraceae bacterium]|nr:IS630 family transposase [Atribacteraceae bacterium]